MTTQDIISAVMATDIIQAVGMNAAPEEEKKEFFNSLGALVCEEAFDKIEDVLTEEQQKELDALFETSASAEERVALLKRYIPDFDDIIFMEALILKAEIMQAVREETPIAPSSTS